MHFPTSVVSYLSLSLFDISIMTQFLALRQDEGHQQAHCKGKKRNYTITRRQILESSKLKEFADDSFKFEENGRKLSKRVENNVGKGEIAHYEQFLLFPQCFQKAGFPGASKGVIVWEWVIMG